MINVESLNDDITFTHYTHVEEYILSVKVKYSYYVYYYIYVWIKFV